MSSAVVQAAQTVGGTCRGARRRASTIRSRSSRFQTSPVPPGSSWRESVDLLSQLIQPGPRPVLADRPHGLGLPVPDAP